MRSSPRFERGDLRWVVLVDDDSFVFAERLRAKDLERTRKTGNDAESAALAAGVEAMAGAAVVFEALPLEAVAAGTPFEAYVARAVLPGWAGPQPRTTAAGLLGRHDCPPGSQARPHPAAQDLLTALAASAAFAIRSAIWAR